MKKRVLVIGASGSLGQELMKVFSEEYSVVGTYNNHSSNNLIHLDVSEKEEVDSVFKKENPEIVLLSAAKTNVEQCEIDPKDSFKKNVLGVENVVGNCGDKKVIFYSTDFVFDGLEDVYSEIDVPNPINVYGRDKLAAERIVGESPEHLIIRTSRHYGINPGHQKYVGKLIQKLANGEEVKSPVGSKGNFTFVPDLANATLNLVNNCKSGTYNVVGKDSLSLYEAALEVAKVFGFDSSLVKKVDENYFNNIVKRPSCPLSIEKLAKEGVNMKNFNEGLNEIWRFQNG